MASEWHDATKTSSSLYGHTGIALPDMTRPQKIFECINCKV